MAGRLLTVGKTRVSIGSATTTWNLTAAKADTYTRISNTRSIPNFGDSYGKITVDEVDSGRTQKGKGPADAGTGDLTCSRKRDDPGQIALIAASQSEDAFNMRIEIPVGGGKVEVNYISALVMARTKGMGGVTDTQTLMMNLDITEEPLEDPVLATGFAA